MVDLRYCLTNLLFFDIPLSFFWRYISFVYLSFGTFVSLVASLLFEYNFFECNSVEYFFEALFTLLAILLPFKSLVASAVF